VKKFYIYFKLTCAKYDGLPCIRMGDDNKTSLPGAYAGGGAGGGVITHPAEV